MQRDVLEGGLGALELRRGLQLGGAQRGHGDARGPFARHEHHLGSAIRLQPEELDRVVHLHVTDVRPVFRYSDLESYVSLKTLYT